MACAISNIEIVQILSERGADVGALDWVRLENCVTTVVVVDAFPKLAFIVVFQRLQTPLHAACFHGGKEVVELLLERGSNIEAHDNVR